MELGMKVDLTLRKPYATGSNNVVFETLRNVGEIHYGYGRTDRVAFESNIHGTGITYEMAHIVEFEAMPEIEQADRF